MEFPLLHGTIILRDLVIPVKSLTVNSFVKYLKVSKSRKQNTKFAILQQNFVHFFALASKSG